MQMQNAKGTYPKEKFFMVGISFEINGIGSDALQEFDPESKPLLKYEYMQRLTIESETKLKNCK